MNIIELKKPSLMEVTSRLRYLADQMENGEVEKAVHIIVIAVGEDGKIHNYGFGQIGDTAHEIGTLFAAAIQLST